MNHLSRHASRNLFIQRLVSTVLLAAVFFTGSSSVYAQQISPTPNFGNITVTGFGHFNSVVFDNFGSIEIFSGTLDNFGTLNNNLDSTLNNQFGSTLNNQFGSTLNNDNSTLNNQFGSTLNNDIFSTLNNDNFSTLNNTFSSTLNNTFNSTLNNTNGSTLNNTFNSTLNNTNGSTLNNSATVNIDATSRVIGNGTYTQTAGSTVNNGLLQASDISISGGTLSGTGTLSGPLSATGTSIVAPGNSVGTLTLEGNYTQDIFSTLEIEIDSTGNDVFDISGYDVTLGGILSVSFLDLYRPSLDDIFTFLLFEDRFGDFNNLLFPTFNGLTFDLAYGDGYAQLVTVLAAVETPEPTTLALLSLALLGFGINRRKKV